MLSRNNLFYCILFSNLIFNFFFWGVAPFYPDEPATLINYASALQNDFIFKGNWFLCDHKEINFIHYLPATLLSIINIFFSYIGIRFFIIFVYILLISFTFFCLNKQLRIIYLIVINLAFSGTLGYSLIMFRPEFFILINFYLLFLFTLKSNDKKFTDKYELYILISLIIISMFSGFVHKMGLLLILVNLFFALLIVKNFYFKLIVISLFLYLFYQSYIFHLIACDKYIDIVNFISPMTSSIIEYIKAPSIIYFKFLTLIKNLSYKEIYTINYLPPIRVNSFLMVFNSFTLLTFLFFILSFIYLFFLYLKILFSTKKVNFIMKYLFLYSVSSIFFMTGIFLGDNGMLFYRSPLYYQLLAINFIILLIVYDQIIIYKKN